MLLRMVISHVYFFFFMFLFCSQLIFIGLPILHLVS